MQYVKLEKTVLFELYICYNSTYYNKAESG